MKEAKIILPSLSFSLDSSPVTLMKMRHVKINTKYPQRKLMQLLTLGDLRVSHHRVRLGPLDSVFRCGHQGSQACIQSSDKRLALLESHVIAGLVYYVKYTRDTWHHSPTPPDSSVSCRVFLSLLLLERFL